MLAASSSTSANAMNRRVSTGHSLNPREASRHQSRPQSASSLRSAVIDQEGRISRRSSRGSSRGSQDKYVVPQMGDDLGEGEMEEWILDDVGTPRSRIPSNLTVDPLATPEPNVAQELRLGELSPEDAQSLGVKDPSYKGNKGESVRFAIRRLTGRVHMDDVLEDLYIMNNDEGRVIRTCFVMDSTVIDPHSWWYKHWAWFVIALNLLCAAVTPYEVVYLPIQTKDDPVFWVNRALDICFGIDLVVNLNLGFDEKHSSRTDRLPVTDRERIFWRYVSSGWLFIDFFSIVPLHLISSQFMPLRLLRLLRLGKLYQLMEPNGTVRVWQIRNGISFNATELILCFFSAVITVYYISCFWYLSSGWTDGEDSSSWSWVEKWYYRRYGVFEDESVHDPERVFAISIYHGIMTLTTIGYGDVTPSTTDERWVSATIMQLMGAALYAYIIAMASILVGSLHRYDLDTQGDADDATDLCDDFCIDDKTTAKAREYLIYSSSTTKLNNWIQLLNLMSPTLQLQAIQQSLLPIIDTHPALSKFELAAKVSLCLRFEIRTYDEGESITLAGPCKEMIFSKQGVSYNGRIIGPGNVIVGEETLLHNGSNRKPVRALTRCVVFVLSSEAIDQTRADFPISDKVARKWAIRRAFARDVITSIRRLRPAMFDNKGRRIVDKSMTVTEMEPLVTIKSELESAPPPYASPGKASLNVGPYMGMTVEFKDYLQLQHKLKCNDDDMRRALDQHADLHLKLRREQQRLQKVFLLMGLTEEDMRGTGGHSPTAEGGGVGVGTGQSNYRSKRDSLDWDENKLMNSTLIPGSKRDYLTDTMHKQISDVIKAHTQIIEVNTNQIQEKEDDHLESRFRLSEALNYPLEETKNVGLGIRDSDALFGVERSKTDDVPTYFKPKRRKAALAKPGSQGR